MFLNFLTWMFGDFSDDSFVFGNQLTGTIPGMYLSIFVLPLPCDGENIACWTCVADCHFHFHKSNQAVYTLKCRIAVTIGIISPRYNTRNQEGVEAMRVSPCTYLVQLLTDLQLYIHSTVRVSNLHNVMIQALLESCATHVRFDSML